MTPKALLDKILRLPADERLRLVEDIWDSLAEASDHVPVPEWHREELDRRLADRSERANISWNEVRSRLRRAKG